MSTGPDHQNTTEGRSIESNLTAELLDEYAPLHREADFLLREELREITLYHAVLSAIAAGRTTAQDIAREAGVDPRGLSYYLQQLMELGYVERRYPLIDGEPPPTRSVRYDLADPLLRFWFRFVFPSLNALHHLGPEKAFRDLIRPHLDSWFGQCFERLCREALPWLYEKEGVAARFEVGACWSKTTQIDVVGLRDDGWTDLGECKWGPVRSARSVEEELERKVREYPNRRGATIGRRVFTRQGGRGGAGGNGVRWHSLEDLYT